MSMSGYVYEISGLVLKSYLGTDETVVVPKEVRFVGAGAFENNQHIRTVVFSTDLYEIREGAFMRCRNLKNIIFPSSVESIAEDAFCGCSSIERLDIPAPVCVLGSGVFKGCTSLRELIFPDTLSQITCYDSLNKNVVIRAKKGSMAQKLTKLAGFRFEPLDETVGEGFYPWYSYGRPVVFCNPRKGVCKQIISQGCFVEFPDYEHPDMLLKKHYDSKELPYSINGRVEFSKVGAGYRVYMNIQRDSWYEYGESGYEHIDMYADMDDEGNFLTKFRICQIGARKYEDTDLEQQEYAEYLKRIRELKQ